ncbi:MAG TPA: DUF11 domain-containing protein [Pirellulaceae bacterium]
MATAAQCNGVLTGALRLPLAVCCAVVALSFCSCQTLPRQTTAAPAKQTNSPVAQPSYQPRPMATPNYPVQPAGFHGQGRCACQGGGCPCCGPGTLPAFAFSGAAVADLDQPWKPDGIKGPWPRDEYLCDGGDLNHDVNVKRDWTVVGLDQEDTIAHFDTLDGQRLVAASNCVCVYAPRFAAIRQVSTPVIYEGHERMAGVEKPVRVNVHEETRGAKTALQPEQVIAQVGLDQVQRFRERTQGLLIDQATRLELAAEAFLPREELLFIQRGEFDNSEKARLAQKVAAALTWTIEQSPQVLIEGTPAVEARGTSTPQVTYTYETFGKPCLRLCKIADKSEAKPGEIVTFTLRFDNLGEQPIGNVTIIDNLVPRLEYVAGSAQSTLKAAFSTQEQLPGESLVLRWEIEEPLPVNAGGVVRFQARVR